MRHAEIPGQTINIDLCFVPAIHQAETTLPTVSGSSGRLKLTTQKTEAPDWPGKVFEDCTKSYNEAMTAYVQARQKPPVIAEPKAKYVTKGEIQRRTLLSEQEALRIHRRQIRLERKQQDQAWQHLRKQRQDEKAAIEVLDATQRRQNQQQIRASETAWKAQRAVRQKQICTRKREDEVWRVKRQHLKAELENIGVITRFLAILVLVDNCTRQCLALPLFVASVHLTAEMVVDALQALLPQQLQYLIADRGVHFRAKAIQTLAEASGFVRVLLAPHRPQSNGIAERFIRTLKEWLETQTWQCLPEMIVALEQFILYYNDRPHQGKELKSLSPNEYCRRLELV